MPPEPLAALPDFVPRLNRLIESYRWRDTSGAEHQFDNESLAQHMAEFGVEVSSSYIYLMRQGKRQNPSGVVLYGLCRAFDVPATYWFDEAVADSVFRRLDEQRNAT